MASDHLQLNGDCRCVLVDSFRWLWTVLGACRWFWVDSGGFQGFGALIATVKFVALNLKEVDNCGKFL